MSQEVSGSQGASEPSPAPGPVRASLPPLPSWGIALVGALSLVCLALTAALAIAATEPAHRCSRRGNGVMEPAGPTTEKRRGRAGLSWRSRSPTR